MELRRADFRKVEAGTDAAGWRAVATCGAAASGLLHFGAALAHAGHGTRYVLFFAAVGAVQLVLAGLLRQRPHPALVLGAVLGTLALIGAYAAQRLGVLPSAADHHWVGPGVAAIGLATLAAEVITVTALPLLAAGRWRSSSFNAALLGGAALWALWLIA